MTDNETDIYSKYYLNKFVRISYRTSEHYERVATGTVVEVTDDDVIVHTIKDEHILIGKTTIQNVSPLKDMRGEPYGKKRLD